MEILPDFGKNAAYIWACYGVGLVLVGSAILSVLWNARSARQKLERLKTSDEDAA